MWRPVSRRALRSRSSWRVRRSPPASQRRSFVSWFDDVEKRYCTGATDQGVPSMHQVKLLLAAALVGLGVIASAAAAPPNDPLYASYQWGPQQIRAEQAWSTSRGAGQVIAIVDSGIDLAHPDLAGKIAGGATFTGCASTGP